MPFQFLTHSLWPLFVWRIKVLFLVQYESFKINNAVFWAWWIWNKGIHHIWRKTRLLTDHVYSTYSLYTGSWIFFSPSKFPCALLLHPFTFVCLFILHFPCEQSGKNNNDIHHICDKREFHSITSLIVY